MNFVFLIPDKHPSLTTINREISALKNYYDIPIKEKPDTRIKSKANTNKVS